MAASNCTESIYGFIDYHENIWGDLIYSTKLVLQIIGIAPGRTFPGEPGGPKRYLNVIDPRGFKCRVQKAEYVGEEIYSASIIFPGREHDGWSSDWQYFKPGVQRRGNPLTDDFLGSADHLVAAGLVPSGHFPGSPGMGKAVVIIHPNGSLQSSPTGSPRENKAPGTRRIEKYSKNKYVVKIHIPDSLTLLRRAACEQSEAEWEARMLALPRPARIDGALWGKNQPLREQPRPGLRLVWSKPSFVPGFNPLPPGPFLK